MTRGAYTAFVCKSYVFLGESAVEVIDSAQGVLVSDGLMDGDDEREC